MARYSKKNTALKWQPEVWGWMNILFTTSYSVQLWDKVIIKIMVLRTYKATFIWNLSMSNKYGSAGEISPGKAHIAPGGSLVGLGPARAKHHSFGHISPLLAWVEQPQDHPKAGGFAHALQEGKPKWCAHLCRVSELETHLNPNILFLCRPLHPKAIYLLSPWVEATQHHWKASFNQRIPYTYGHSAAQRAGSTCTQQRLLLSLGMNFSYSHLLAFPIHTLLENSNTIYCTNKIQSRVTCKLVSVIYRAIRFLYWSLEIPTEGVIKQLKKIIMWYCFWSLRNGHRASQNSLPNCHLHLIFWCWWLKKKWNKQIGQGSSYRVFFYTVIINIVSSAWAELFFNSPFIFNWTKKNFKKAFIWNRKPSAASLWWRWLDFPQPSCWASASPVQPGAPGMLATQRPFGMVVCFN